jgi:RimJ/RimL family protein N-acetyltransferase
VVLGAAYSDEEIFELKRKFPERLYLHKNLAENELVNLMLSCNFAIAPTSTICYELCCIKIPILGGYFVENQKDIYEELANHKVIIEGGDFTNYETSDFYFRIKTILAQQEGFRPFITKQKELFDGKSNVRILGLINSLNLSFRRSNEEDLMIVYNWSNDQLVRENSYHSDKIKLEDHKNWFLEKISSSKVLFLIGLVNDNPAGILRYEIKDDHAVVGVLVSKEYRGQKLASEFLIASATLFFKEQKKPVLAYIKKENIASIKSFEKAGYHYFREEAVSGHNSFVYKLDRKDVIR